MAGIWKSALPTKAVVVDPEGVTGEVAMVVVVVVTGAAVMAVAAIVVVVVMAVEAGIVVMVIAEEATAVVGAMVVDQEVGYGTFDVHAFMMNTDMMIAIAWILNIIK